VRPSEELLEATHPDPVAVGVGGQALLAGMTAMPVEDDADVTGQPVPIETVYEVVLVQAVENTKSHGVP
jgi:hypothetical protein